MYTYRREQAIGCGRSLQWPNNLPPARVATVSCNPGASEKTNAPKTKIMKNTALLTGSILSVNARDCMSGKFFYKIRTFQSVLVIPHPVLDITVAACYRRSQNPAVARRYALIPPTG